MSLSNFSKVPKDVLEVAQYLISSDSKMKNSSGVLNGRFVKYFKGKDATHALLSKTYKSSEKRPTIDSYEKAAEYMKKLIGNNLILRVHHSPNPKNDSSNQTQEYNDDFFYIWTNKGSQLKTLLLKFTLLLTVLLGIILKIWPKNSRKSAYSILNVLMWVMVGFFIMVIFRFILYLISRVACKRSIWLFPNLFADVGIAESFQPVLGYDDDDEEPEKNKTLSSQESFNSKEIPYIYTGESHMKILFFGRGAIGTQYAWAFEKAGHTVEFYVREGRKEQYGSHVNLEISDGRRTKYKIVKEQWPVEFCESIEPSKNYDLIFLSINPQQVKSAVEYLTPRVGNSTILFFNNFGKDPLKAMEPIPSDQIVIGFPGAGGGYENNTLYGNLFQQVQMGVINDTLSKREKEVKTLFETAGFKVTLQKDIQGWLLNHYVLNTAMEAEVLKYGSFEQVIKSDKGLADMIRNIKEMVPYSKLKKFK